MRNDSLKRSIDFVLEKINPTMAAMSLTLRSATDIEWEFSPLYVKSMRIEQPYGEAGQEGTSGYTDEIYITVPISPRDYIKLFDRSQDLTATLTAKKTDNTGNVRSKYIPERSEYVAVLVDPIDVRRMVPDAHLRPSLDMEVTFRLVERAVYLLRHFKINGIYADVTVEEVIRHIAAAANIQTLNLVTPDNVHRYKHIVIPPVKAFDEVFTFLQSRYGIYMKGLDYYFSQGVLYIYPSYETKPKSITSVEFYAADRGDFAGRTSFHRVDGTQIRIILQGVADVVDLSIASAENIGTSRMFLRSSRLVDGFLTISGNDMVVNPEVALSINNTQSRPSISGVNNSVYDKPTDNPFAQASMLEKNRALLVHTRWKMAVPFLIKPNTAIRFTYDDKGQIKTYQGIIERGEYRYAEVNRTADGVVHACTANLILRLDPVQIEE